MRSCAQQPLGEIRQGGQRLLQICGAVNLAPQDVQKKTMTITAQPAFDRIERVVAAGDVFGKPRQSRWIRGLFQLAMVITEPLPFAQQSCSCKLAACDGFRE